MSSSFTSNNNTDNSKLTVCRKCRGEGQVAQRKKGRAKAVVPMKPCPICFASGLVMDESMDSDDGEISKATKVLPTVAIIGGGIGGFSLALACSHRNIPYTVYERDGSFDARKQGYGLTLQQASKSLKGFGISSLAGGLTSTRHLVHTANGQVVGEWGLRKWGRSSSKTPPKRQNIHIARQALRNALYNPVIRENVEWNCQLTNVREEEDRVHMTFCRDDGSTFDAQADYCVGADGIRSVVRQHVVVPSMPLKYLNCIVILGICPLARLPSHDLFDGATVFQTADGTTRLYSMPFSETEYMWQLSYPEDEETALATSGRTDALKQASLQKCATWHNPIPQLLEATPSELISGYPVYDRPLLETNMMQSNRITLIGDAAHPMSPFKGQGANQAMLDALKLARAMYRDPSTTASLKVYQEEMVTRTAPKVQASADAATFLHTDVAIQQGNVTRGAAAAAAAVASKNDTEKEL